MPQAAGAAVASWFVSLGASVGAASVAFIVTYGVVTVGISVGLNKLSQALAGKPKTQFGSQTRDVVVKNTVEPRQLIYGETRTAGTLVFYGCSGTENRYLWFVIAVAGHQCEDITDCWVGPILIPDADIAGDGTVSTSDFIDGDSISRLVIRRHLGAGNQSVDSQLDSEFTEWTSDHKGLGVAYVAYRLDRADDVWKTGAPSAFYHLVKGRRLYDPRKDTTNDGSGSHRVNDATTWEWSRNAALAVRDYISGGAIVYTSATPDKRLAVGESDSRIDDTYVIAAANICDEDVVIPPEDTPDITQKRYTCDTQISCGTPHMQNLEILNSAMIGHLSYVEGKYRVFAGAYDTPTVDIVEDDIVGPVEISTHPHGEDNYNLVIGTFYDELKSWQLTPFPARTNATYESNDGGQQARSIELLATRTSYRAQRIAEVHLKQSRNKQLIKFTALSPKAMNISEWETFTVTISEYGWNEQVMRCLEWEFLPNGFIAITARIEGSAPYADPEVEDYATAETSSTPAPQIEIPAAPQGLTAVGAPNEIVFTVGPPTYFAGTYTIELWEHTSSTPFSSAVKVAEIRSNKITLSKRDTTTRYYWITARSTTGAISSEYPSGAGVAAAAGLVQTPDMEDDAVTELYANDEDWAGSAPASGNLANFISFVPEKTGTVIATFDGAGKSNLDKDSGSYLLFAMGLTDDLVDLGGGNYHLGGSPESGSSAWLQPDTTSVSFSYEFDVTEGIDYTVGVVALHPFGTFNLYDSHLRLLVRKR